MVMYCIYIMFGSNKEHSSSSSSSSASAIDYKTHNHTSASLTVYRTPLSVTGLQETHISASLADYRSRSTASLADYRKHTYTYLPTSLSKELHCQSHGLRETQTYLPAFSLQAYVAFSRFDKILGRFLAPMSKSI